MADNKSNTRARKWQVTINHPQEHNINHGTIHSLMQEISWKYYCLCDEVGEQGTPHIHLYFVCENAVRFSTVKKLFTSAHIEVAHGSSQENRDYIRKEGKYLNSDKKETNHIDTFEEYGELPLDKATKNESVSEQVLRMIQDGCSNSEIIQRFPSYGTKIQHLDRMRQTFLEEKFKNEWRDVKVTYIYGEAGTGKTRYVMDTYGYENVYKVTNYENPFDNYRGEPVLLLDEFYSSLLFNELLQYLDGYPCRLPARYADKIACFTKVFIISNISLKQQYKNIQYEQPQSWNALIRRIDRVVKFERNTDGKVPFYEQNEVMSYDEMVSDYYLKEGGNHNV